MNCKGTLRQVVYLSEAQNPLPSPLNIVYVSTLYSVLIRTGKEGGGGGEEWTREKGERGNSSQSWVENTNMIVCVSSL